LTTVIVTTHNPAEAYLLADKVFSIINGSISETYYENIFQGEVRTANRTKIFSKSDVEICLVSDKVGRAIISIDPRDILISPKPLDSSARNSFRGTIREISEIKGQVRVVVDAGLDFAAMITKESCTEMALMIGAEVFLTFKASSVHVY
jgi:molybdate/tungstate transport system ATP-binding protein